MFLRKTAEDLEKQIAYHQTTKRGFSLFDTLEALRALLWISRSLHEHVQADPASRKMLETLRKERAR
jgi:hypothetical protein